MRRKLRKAYENPEQTKQDYDGYTECLCERSGVWLAIAAQISRHETFSNCSGAAGGARAKQLSARDAPFSLVRAVTVKKQPSSRRQRAPACLQDQR
jgi:hypothetical protein